MQYLAKVHKTQKYLKNACIIWQYHVSWLTIPVESTVFLLSPLHIRKKCVSQLCFRATVIDGYATVGFKSRHVRSTQGPERASREVQWIAQAPAGEGSERGWCLTGLASFFHFKARLSLTEWFSTQNWHLIKCVIDVQWWKAKGFKCKQSNILPVNFCMTVLIFERAFIPTKLSSNACILMENISHNTSTTFLNENKPQD